MTEIEKVKGEIKVLQSKLALLEELDRVKSPAEEAFKRVYCRYPDKLDSAWDIFEKGYARAQKDYKVGEYEPTPQERGDRIHWEVEKLQEKNWYVDAKDLIEWDEKDNPKPMNEVMDRLENKYKDAEENAASYMTDEVVNRMLKKWEENPPEFLKFEMGKTLEALITRWWCDVFGGINQDWDMETAIADLCDRVELWLPKEQDSSGTQDVSVIDLVDGYNDALKKIKSKLRNKKSNK